MRKLTIKELKQIIMEEFGKMKNVEDVKTKEGWWHKVDVENLINWKKELSLKEYVKKLLK